MEKVQTVKKKKKMHGIYTLNTDCSQKAILRTEVSVFFHSAVSFMQSTVPAHGLFMMWIFACLLFLWSPAVAQMVKIVIVSQDSVNTQNADEDVTSVTAYCLAVMCFLMMGHRVWWPQWIRCWCWTALCGSPPRCSAPPWAAGSCPPRLGLNWPCCPTQSWFPWCSAACCSELWTVTTSDEVWSRRWLPGLWIHVSAWEMRQNKSCAKL